jgi:hypothetical protein
MPLSVLSSVRTVEVTQEDRRQTDVTIAPGRFCR